MDDDEDEEDEEDDGDENKEIDLSEEEDSDEGGEQPDGEATEEGMEMVESEYYEYGVPEGAELIQEDTNSIDISRMVAK